MEYGSLENSLKAMEKNAEYGGQPEILAPVHVIERESLFTMKTKTKALCFKNFFTDRPSIDIFYYPEEGDDKGEL